MNTIKLSAVAVLLSSTFAMAGGDISPVEPNIEVPSVETEKTKSGFYAGLGYSCMQLTHDTPDLEVTAMTALSVSAGYNINKFLAVEGRYTASIGDLEYKNWNTEIDEKWDMSNIGLYLKPQFNVASVGMYALLGYGQTTFDNGTSYSVDGLQYGLGITATATKDINVYVDYRRLFDDSEFDTYVSDRDTAVNSFTVGVNYNF